MTESFKTTYVVFGQSPDRPGDRMASLNESLQATNQSTLTCPTCRVTIPIRNNKPRQYCSFCGSLYNTPSSPAGQTDSSVELPRIGNIDRITSVNNLTSAQLGNIFFGNIFDRRLCTFEPEANSEPVRILGSQVLPLRRYLNQGNVSPSLEDKLRHYLASENGDDRRRTRVGSTSSLPSIKPQDFRNYKISPISSRRNSHSEERISKLRENSTNQKPSPSYPIIDIKRHELMKEIKEAKKTKNFNEVKKFYFTTFESYCNICATFKKDPTYDGAIRDDPGLKTELIQVVNDSMIEMSPLVHKYFLKGVINALLEEHPLLYGKDQVRALFIIIQSPVFLSQSSYNVLAHVLKSIIQLANGDHQLLVAWFKTLEVSKFRLIIRFTTQFITVRQFPPPDRSLPPITTSKWWIPVAVRVLAIFYASNISASPPLVHYTEFYNHALDHVDLMQEYNTWQAPPRPDSFSFCQYPFVLSIVAKRFILTKDAEQQMILSARKSLVQRVALRQQPQIDIFFLNIHVRRSHLVEDSLKEIASKKSDLKKKLKISFHGEPGLDMGGLTKEWFLLLVKQIFLPENKMVVYHTSTRLHWFCTSSCGSLKEYNLIGVLMGLAVYNSIILDVRFPAICFRKLLSPPVVPNFEHIPVGVAKDLTLQDLSEIMPEVAHGLKELLKYEGNVEEDMYLTFEVSLDEFGSAKTFKLKEDGDNIPVTNENREEFVNLYLDWILNTAIYEQFRAFYMGFHTVTASNALITLRPEEVEMLVCGSPTLDLKELRKVTEYDGYNKDDPVIKWFWELLNEMSIEQQKLFLLFTTGSDRIPVGGMGELPFKISCWRDQTHMLPQAHTCFNQVVLPPYKSKEKLLEKLLIAINNAEGFGLE